MTHSQPTVLFNNSCDTGSPVWPVKYRHSGVLEEQHQQKEEKKQNTYTHSNLAWSRQGCILKLWRDINAPSGRQRPDISGSAAICEDDSGKRDWGKGSQLLYTVVRCIRVWRIIQTFKDLTLTQMSKSFRVFNTWFVIWWIYKSHLIRHQTSSMFLLHRLSCLTWLKHT